MHVWAVCMFSITCFDVIVKVAAVSFLDYPREITKAEHFLDVLVGLVWLIWGAMVIK